MNSDFKDIILEMNKLQTMNLEIVKKEVEFIINNKITNYNEIEKTFDKILDLAFWYGNDIDKLFYNLYNYYKKINFNSSKDYEKYYIKVLKKEI